MSEICNEKLEKVEETMYEGYFVSNFLGKIQSIRNVDAANIFPAQLTRVGKKILKENGNNGHSPKADEKTVVMAQTRLLEKKSTYKV